MTVVQKADPYQERFPSLFDRGKPCSVCDEPVRGGDEVVPALKPVLTGSGIAHRGVLAHYLCAVWADDNCVSRSVTAKPQAGDGQR